MRTDPLVVCNNILDLAFKEDIAVTPMKLQKLLYFIYKEYLQQTNESLFSERFEAWKYGPVLSKVYDVFGYYEDNRITKFYQIEKSFKLNEDTNPQVAQVLNKIWNKYKDYTGIYLASLTYEKNTAWRKAWNKGETFLNDLDIQNEAELKVELKAQNK